MSCTSFPVVHVSVKFAKRSAANRQYIGFSKLWLQVLSSGLTMRVGFAFDVKQGTKDKQAANIQPQKPVATLAASYMCICTNMSEGRRQLFLGRDAQLASAGNKLVVLHRMCSQLSGLQFDVKTG
jgi:hypothetical protein